ncbi:unnamed protein product, partial [Brenthis ino]
MSETLNLESDLCRCCHAQGGFDNLAVPQTYLEQVEIYSDMLKECFNIEIAPVPGELCALTYKICKACIKKLRNASNFRKQVKNCEERFLDMYYTNRIKVFNSSIMPVVKEEAQDLDIDVEVFKEETPHMDDNGDEDFHLSDEDGYDDDKEELECTDDERNIMKTDKCDKDMKTNKKLKKPGLPRRTDEEKKCKKERQSKRMKFRLQPGDYKKDGDRVVCSHCERVYYKICSLRFHIKTKHYKIPQYKCSHCSKEFMTLAPFTIHKLEEHNIDERFNCNACKGKKTSFDEHYTLKEDCDGTQYICKICSNSYKKRDFFKQHYRHVHLKQRPKLIGCYYCAEKVTAHMRASHLERVHGVPAPTCGACGKKFSYPFQVLRHQKTYHMGEKKYVCKICDKTFATSGNLAQHEVKHSSDRPFKCDFCEETFKWKKHLRRHVLIHMSRKQS